MPKEDLFLPPDAGGKAWEKLDGNILGRRDAPLLNSASKIYHECLAEIRRRHPAAPPAPRPPLPPTQGFALLAAVWLARSFHSTPACGAAVGRASSTPTWTRSALPGTSWRSHS